MKIIKILVLAIYILSLPLGDGIAQENIKDSPDLISINFQNTDINQVIKVLGDITNTVIIPNHDLKGKVTIVSLERVHTEAVVNILESALMVRGFTLVRSGSALKVVPLTDTKQTNVAVKIGIAPDQIKEKDIVITQVMPLEYSSAIKIKNDLQPLVGKHGNILANERTNTLILTDTSSNIKRLATIISQMERQLPAKMQVKPFMLNYGDVEKIAKILKDLSQDETKGAQYPQSSSKLPVEGAPLEIFGPIEAYPELETNSIVVATAAVNFPAIEKLINELDVFPPQAMIEVIILDVTLDDDLTRGIELSHPTTPTQTTSGLKVDAGGTGGGYPESIFHSLLGLATDASTKGFTYRIFNEKETANLLGFILNSQENSKVISTPRILASNNQESSITVGQELPIKESQVTDLVNNITTVNYKYEDVGLQLKVVPRISKDGYVNLQVHAELKDLSAQTLFDASIINTREADATVIVPNGYTVVLGGLIKDNDSIIEHKVPLLGDLPFIGNLFKKTETSLLKTELLIFITPHVLKNTKDLVELTKPAKDKLKIMQEAINKQELKQAVKKVVGYQKRNNRNYRHR